MAGWKLRGVQLADREDEGLPGKIGFVLRAVYSAWIVTEKSVPSQRWACGQKKVNTTFRPVSNWLVGTSATKIPVPVSRAVVSCEVVQPSLLQCTVAGTITAMRRSFPAGMLRHLLLKRHSQ